MGDHDTRFKLTLHYDGSAFHGWQVQPRDETVQGALERALEQLAGVHVSVLGSGRTDAGVHATGQVASLSMASHWTESKLRRSLNAILPKTVWVAEALEVHEDFHPRYDALARTYEYRVGCVEEANSPFARNACWPLGIALDMDMLQEAADPIVGTHSFQSFAKAGQPERGFECAVSEARWAEWSPLGVRLSITANRYLHRMVRYLVGTMVDVARQRRPLADMRALLQGAAGSTTSPPAPPEGLFLARVSYPDVGEKQR